MPADEYWKNEAQLESTRHVPLPAVVYVVSGGGAPIAVYRDPRLADDDALSRTGEGDEIIVDAVEIR